MTDETEEQPRYRAIEEIESFELINGFKSLALFDGEPYLIMQAYNLSVVDQFLNDVEMQTLRALIEQERTPIPEAVFLNAQSQMWIFAAYEILRTWRQRARNIIKWVDNHGLLTKIKDLKERRQPRDLGRDYLLSILERVRKDASLVVKIRRDIKRTHVMFHEVEFIRIALAKHEVRRKNTPARAPGYGRINSWCGAMDYEMDNGAYVVGTINRRDIAEDIRLLAKDSDPPTDDEIAEFDKFMRGDMQA